MRDIRHTSVSYTITVRSLIGVVDCYSIEAPTCMSALDCLSGKHVIIHPKVLPDTNIKKYPLF